MKFIIDFIKSLFMKEKPIELPVTPIKGPLNPGGLPDEPIKCSKEIPKYSITIEDLACAIKKHEGWFIGSRSYRNNSPGNLKFANQLHAIGKDVDNFAIFKTYEDGWEALMHQLTIACKGGSKIYNPEMTLLEFFQKYDESNPKVYAFAVATALKIPLETKMKEFV